MDLVDLAVELLVTKRWPILPSRGAQKKPCVPWLRFQRELPTAEQIRGWEHRFHPERWGVVTGSLAGIIVADFDGEKGVKLMRAWGIKPHLRTGSGGFHCYLGHPGWPVPTMNAKSARRIWQWPGLDIRGDGGFAVLLGRNANGPYVQLRERQPEPFDVLPQAVRDFLRDRSQHGRENVGRSIDSKPLVVVSRNGVGTERLIGMALEIAGNSGRNNAGFWLACQLRDNGYSNADAASAMHLYRSRVPSTSLKGEREAYTEAECDASCKEAYSRPARAPWARRRSQA